MCLCVSESVCVCAPVLLNQLLGPTVQTQAAPPSTSTLQKKERKDLSWFWLGYRVNFPPTICCVLDLG